MRAISLVGLCLLAGYASVACKTAPDDVTELAAEISTSRVVNLAIGPSVPSRDPNWNISSIVSANGGAPTRRTGGEVIAFKFFDSDASDPISVKVKKIRLIGFSKSGQGKVLVRSFDSLPAMPNGTFDPLTKFASVAAESHAQNHNGMVFLGAGDSVTLVPASELTLTHFLPTFEAFGNDDASIDVQLELSADARSLAVGFARSLADAGGSSSGETSSSGGSSSGETSSSGGSSSGGTSSSGGSSSGETSSSGGSSSGETSSSGGSSSSGAVTPFCQVHPFDPGCPSFCQINPFDASCPSHCDFQPFDPGCPAFCQSHPFDASCPSHCDFQPFDPGCPAFCQSNPFDASCTH
jgi:hypothetical protein